MKKIEIKFSSGSLILSGTDSKLRKLSGLLWDDRIEAYRAPAYLYRDLMLQCQKFEIPVIDLAREYSGLGDMSLKEQLKPRPHQSRAMDAWLNQGSLGVVALPTGAGKSFLAVMCIAAMQRPALIVVPTLDLVEQWQHLLERFFRLRIGILAGGMREIRALTVATYHTASMIMENYGSQFGLLICDECHHLPASQFQQIAISSIAPFRLGISATPERSDGGEEVLFELLGPLAYQGGISEMVDQVLSPYKVITIEVALSDKEHADYKAARATYLSFLRRNSISMASRSGWGEFIKKASFIPGGVEALAAFRLQKKIASGASGKISQVWNLISRHVGEKILIFTNDNEFAYRLGRELVLPVLTHQTKLAERKLFLMQFRSGQLNILVTSKVLNEGVDVPDASIGIVVSGSSGVREHVQRLGRILRHRPGKKAVLYEIISKDTSEQFVNERRRMHDAYKGIAQV